MVIILSLLGVIALYVYGKCPANIVLFVSIMTVQYMLSQLVQMDDISLQDLKTELHDCRKVLTIRKRVRRPSSGANSKLLYLTEALCVQ